MRDKDIKSSSVIPTPFGQGIRIMGKTYIDSKAVLKYIHQELSKAQRTRDAILTELQATLNSMP